MPRPGLADPNSWLLWLQCSPSSQIEISSQIVLVHLIYPNPPSVMAINDIPWPCQEDPEVAISQGSGFVGMDLEAVGASSCRVFWDDVT